MKRLLLSCLLLFSLSASTQTVTDLLLEATDYFKQGEYEKVIPVAEKALPEVEKLLGTDNLVYLGTLTMQAYCCEKTFRYQQAETLYKRLIDLHRVSVDPEHEQHYATSMNNLATLYEKMGLYDKAEILLISAAAITKRIAGEKDSAYATSLNNLAALYHAMGKYQAAEPLYIRAKDTKRYVFGENGNYALGVNNLATLYLEMGQAEKSKPLFEEAVRIWKKDGAKSESDYAMGLNNLASVHEDLQQYSKADSLYTQSLQLRKRLYGENHPDYAMSLNNMASLYTRMGQFKKAEPLMQQAGEIWKRILGENHPNYALSLNNQAALFRKSGTQYAKAESLYKQALALRKKILGEKHPLCADTENDLGMLYLDMKRYTEVEPHLMHSSGLFLENMRQTFAILSEKEKANYLQFNFSFTEVHHSYLYSNQQASADALWNSLNLQMGFKALSLSDTRNMLASVRNNPDTSLQRKFNAWQGNRSLLTKQYALPAGSRMPDIDKLEEQTELLEKELNRLSTAFRNQQQALAISGRDIASKLGDGEAAIEFVRFRLYKNNWTDSVMYAAYVIRKGDEAPVFVPLFEEKQLERLCEKKGKSPTQLARNLYAPMDTMPGRKRTPGDSLYQLVWQPLEKHLDGIKKISYSPAGKLYGIAFLALPWNDNQLLVDKYELRQYTSTRQVALRSGTDDPAPGPIHLFGDPKFSMDSTAISNRGRKDAAYASRGGKDDNDVRGMTWRDLPGTAEEIKVIQKLFQDNGITTTIHTREEASEENLKFISGNAPRILHIATHGFFLPAPTAQQKVMGGPVFSQAADPLLRSGLVMAGGNYVWSGKTPVEGAEDGVITAYEIAQLNLSNISLVSLSACETGLGDVKGSEGVFGLQRSFKMAGVNKMLVSLWEVPDKETVELMTTFYDNWLNGADISSAFNAAQSAMRKKYPPYYWAAFVLVE